MRIKFATKNECALKKYAVCALKIPNLSQRLMNFIIKPLFVSL